MAKKPKGVGARRVRRFEPSGSPGGLDTELRRIGELLDDAEDAKKPSLRNRRCIEALSGFFEAGVEAGGTDLSARSREEENRLLSAEEGAVDRYARRFMRICGLTSRALDSVSERRPRLRGLGKPLAAGGPTFDTTGKGKHCVYDENDKVVRCFQKAETAQEVARGFGSGFYAGKKSKKGKGKRK